MTRRCRTLSGTTLAEVRKGQVAESSTLKIGQIISLGVNLDPEICLLLRGAQPAQAAGGWKSATPAGVVEPRGSSNENKSVAAPEFYDKIAVSSKADMRSQGRAEAYGENGVYGLLGRLPSRFTGDGRPGCQMCGRPVGRCSLRCSGRDVRRHAVQATATAAAGAAQ